MTTFKITTIEERLAERRGAKLLLLGPPGAGKTFQCGLLDPDRTLLLDAEAGDIVIRDWPGLTVRLNDWPSVRDAVVRIAGPGSSIAPSSCYSEAHFQAVGGALPGLEDIDTVFCDSVTEISRLCLRWCAQQPEAFSERTGAKDLRATYGALAHEMVATIQHLQHARA